MCLVVLPLFVILVDRTTLGHAPVNMATVAGQPVTMPCGLTSGDGLILWKFHSTGNHTAKLLFNGYSMSKGLTKHFINGFGAGDFDLAINDSSLEDAGTYQCMRAIASEESYSMEIIIAQLTVLSSASNCGSNASSQGVVEGDQVRIWCSVDYLGNLDPMMQWSTDDGSIVDSNTSYVKASDPYTLTTTAAEIMAPNDQNVTYTCKTYFKSPAIVQDKIDTFTARNAPDYRDECKLTISILYGPRNLSITPRKTTYTMGDRLLCSASGNPSPVYSWRDVDIGNDIEGPFLVVDKTMEQRKTNTYRCTAENMLSGKKKTDSVIITLDVEAASTTITVEVTTMESPPVKSLNVVVGTGSAVGGFVFTVVGIILWRMAKRHCHLQPKENDCAQRGDSPHDYESVNYEDTDPAQQHYTPDIEMDQSSIIIMEDQTIDQSMAEEEEGMADVEILNHYDTLDGCNSVQEPRPYASLEVIYSEEQINHANEALEKTHNYLTLIL